ncbi:MAG: hypothetical protein AUJ28_00345 [Parcubacteria group bacterium CG1_02_37_51]|nr:MAG: hypothetical protein AUJ28_00345 [Parcubacteria group bacterium CG1_02_37_51]
MTTKKRATKGAINKIKQPNIKQKRKRAKKILLVLTGLLIISLGMTIYFGLNEVQQGGQSLSLEIISTAEVVSGQEIVYQIAYENKDEVVLSKINLTLTYPQGFYFKSASFEPTNEGQSYWQLPDLAIGSKGYLEVHGILIGERDEIKELKTVIAYEPINFSSLFSQEATLTQTISDVAIDFWIGKPLEAMSEQNVLFRLHVLNHQKSDWQPIRVDFIKPDHYSILDLDPLNSDAATSDNKLSWNISKMSPEEEMIIIISGELAPEIDLSAINFQSSLWQLNSSGEQLLDSENFSIKIVEPKILVSLQYQDTGDAMVSWGDMIDYELIVKNEGEYIPEELNIILVINTSFINWQSWEDSAGLYRDNNKVVWTAEHPKLGEKLKNLKPGEEIRIKIGAQIQDAPIDFETLSEQELAISAVAKTETIIGFEKFITTSEILNSSIGQGLSLLMQAFYYDIAGNPIGSGPIPPAVDQTTSYIVKWTIKNGLEELSNIKISSTLPPLVEWQGSGSTFKPLIDPTTRNFTINIASLASTAEIGGEFELAITPGNGQLNQFVTLLNPISLTASKNGTSINKQYDLINTDLIYDVYAEGGRVVE